MLDIGWPELLVLLVVAVMVIGPRDLPKAMYTMGKWVRAGRRVTGQMQKHFDEAMREAELEDVRKGLQNASKLNVKKQIQSHVDPKGQLGKSLDVGEGKSVKDYLTGKDDEKSPGAEAGEKAAGAEKAGAGGEKTAGKTTSAKGEWVEPADRPSDDEIRSAKLAAAERSHLAGDEGADKVDVAGVPSPSGTAASMGGDAPPDSVADPTGGDDKSGGAAGKAPPDEFIDPGPAEKVAATPGEKADGMPAGANAEPGSDTGAAKTESNKSAPKKPAGKSAASADSGSGEA